MLYEQSLLFLIAFLESSGLKPLLTVAVLEEQLRVDVVALGVLLSLVVRHDLVEAPHEHVVQDGADELHVLSDHFVVGRALVLLIFVVCVLIQFVNTLDEHVKEQDPHKEVIADYHLGLDVVQANDGPVVVDVDAVHLERCQPIVRHESARLADLV